MSGSSEEFSEGLCIGLFPGVEQNNNNILPWIFNTGRTYGTKSKVLWPFLSVDKQSTVVTS